jgi:formiminotetrahydrofolate cyclodeaminase
MASIIGKQPNGLYCVYSTISDGISMYDCTEEEIVQQRLQDAEYEIRESVKKQIEKSEKNYKTILENLEIHESKEVAENYHNEFSKEVK